MAADRPSPAGGALSRLRHSLQALALPAGTQLGLLPGFTGGAEEFALNFDQWSRGASADGTIRMSRPQREALKAVESLLDRMSGQKNAHLWTRGALRDSREWTRLRKAARDALAAFGWALEVPPGKPYEYIEW
jgi:hypothetical protein